MVAKRALMAVALVGALAWWWHGRAKAPSETSPSGAVSALPAEAPAVAVAARPAGGWPPGAWSVVGGRLLPGRALRERFDSYLPLGHGVTLVDVRAALAQDAEADLGRVNRDEVLALWDRYARLLNHAWQHPFDPEDSRGWPATLGEQHQVRRALLGVDWAEAFFGEDEAALQRRIASPVAARRSSRPTLDDVLARASAASGARAGGSGPTVPTTALMGASGGSVLVASTPASASLLQASSASASASAPTTPTTPTTPTSPTSPTSPTRTPMSVR